MGIYITFKTEKIKNKNKFISTSCLFEEEQEVAKNGMYSKISTLIDGSHVVIWQTTDIAYKSGIYAQRYSKDMVKIGDVFRVNMNTIYNAYLPSIAALDNGNFIVSWWRKATAQGSGNSYEIYAKCYQADGTPIEDEFHVNKDTIFVKIHSTQVCGLKDGRFVIVWEDRDEDESGIYAQLYGQDRKKIGDQFLVNTHTKNKQHSPDIACLKNDNFIIVWQSFDQEPKTSPHFYPGYGIYAQRYHANGTLNGVEFLVNTNTLGFQENPSIAAFTDNSFIIVWSGQHNETYRPEIYAQKYDADGNKITSEFLVNTYVFDQQLNPNVVTMLDYTLITWASRIQDGDYYGIYGQYYTKDGKFGNEFIVNSYIIGNQDHPKATVTLDNQAIIAWNRLGPGGINPGIYIKKITPKLTDLLRPNFYLLETIAYVKSLPINFDRYIFGENLLSFNQSSLEIFGKNISFDTSIFVDKEVKLESILPVSFSNNNQILKINQSVSLSMLNDIFKRLQFSILDSTLKRFDLSSSFLIDDDLINNTLTYILEPTIHRLINENIVGIQYGSSSIEHSNGHLSILWSGTFYNNSLDCKKGYTIVVNQTDYKLTNELMISEWQHGSSQELARGIQINDDAILICFYNKKLQPAFNYSAEHYQYELLG